MASRGKLTGGVIWCSVVLNKDKGGIGDRCAVFLSQDANAGLDAIWHFKVFVLTDQGSLCLGDFRTTPVGLAGELPSRLIATANCPGAIGWSISAQCDDVTQRADCWLSSAPDSSGGETGLTVISSGTRNPTSRRTFFDSTGVQVSGIVAPTHATLWSIEGTMSQAAVPGAQTFVMVFDQVAPPIAGAIPIWTKHLGQTAAGGPPDTTDYYWAPDHGRPIINNLFVATSITPDVYTPDVAHTVSVHAAVTLP